MKRGLSLVIIIGIVLTSGISAVAKETITVAWRTNGQEIKALALVANAFEKKTGINVKIVPVTDDSKLLAMTIAGLSPDVFSSVYQSGLYDYVRRGLCEDLTPYIKKDKVNLSGFYAGAIKRLKFNGKQYGIPISSTPFTVWHNTALLDRAGVKPPPTDWSNKGWTWDDMVNDALKLTKDTNGDGKTDQYGFGGGFWPESTCAWIWGGDFYPDSIYETGLAPKSTVMSEAALKGLQKWIDLKNRYKVVSAVPGFNADAFVKGKTALYQDSLHSFITAANSYPQVKNGRFGIGIMPVGTAPARPVLFTDPWLLAKGSKHKTAAWKWIKFSTMEEGASIMAANYAIAPTTKRYLPEYLKKHGFINSLQKVMESGLDVGDESPNHTISKYNEMNEILLSGMEKAFSGKSTPTEAMKSIQSKLDSALKRNYDKYSKR